MSGWQSSLSRCLDWSRVQSLATLEASRAFRFRPEERGTLLAYLGISEDSFAVEVGCGTGILASYLAAGMPRGFMLGVDITRDFVAFAKARRSAPPNVDFVMGDAYALPIASGTLDASTSYTLLAILLDPGAALREQMRVTKPGGVVSAIEVVRANVGFGGQPRSVLPTEMARQLSSLRERWNRITDDVVEPLERQEHRYGWAGTVEELPLLFESVGLKEVYLRGFFSTFSTSDETYGSEERRWFLRQIGENELAWIDQLRADWREVYGKHGFSDNDKLELHRLILEEQTLRLRDFDDGHHVWAWHGSVNFIVAGRA